MRPRRRAWMPLALALCAGTALPAPAAAQVFLASEPHPAYAIGPLFVIANVKPDLSVLVNVSFSLTPRAGARLEDAKQDLYLLWPAELTDATTPGGADPALVRDVTTRGFTVQSSGRLTMRSRDRLQVGTGLLGEPLPEAASYVTFARASGPGAAAVGPATYVKIPWTAKLTDPLAVLTLSLPMRGLVTPKPAAWFPELFWGRRWVLTVGFGDIGSPIMPLYPLYFERRDRVVRLAREFSLIMANFADAEHLLIEDVEPAAATRRPSRVRAGNEIVTLTLNAAEGVTPQNLKVEFSYFSGRIAWRPIVVSAALLLLGNIAGALMFGREIVQTVRARRRAKAAAAPPRGAWLGDGVQRLVPGGSPYDDIIALWGPPDEERERLEPPGRRTLLYRVPQNGRMHELAIDLDDGRVKEVERRALRLF